MLAPKKGLLCNLNHIHLQHISLGLHLSRHPELQETSGSMGGEDQTGCSDCPQNCEQVDANSNNPSLKCRCCASHTQQPVTLGLQNQVAQEDFPCLHAGEEVASPCDLASSSSSSSVSSCSDFSLDDSPVSVYCKEFPREESQSPKNQPVVVPTEDTRDGGSLADQGGTCDGRDANLNPLALQRHGTLARESPDSLCSGSSLDFQCDETSPSVAVQETTSTCADLDPNCNPLPAPGAAPAAPPAPGRWDPAGSRAPEPRPRAGSLPPPVPPRPRRRLQVLSGHRAEQPPLPARLPEPEPGAGDLCRDAGKKTITSFHELAQKRKRNAAGPALAQARADRSDWLIVFSPDTELPPASELLSGATGQEPAQPQHDWPARPPSSQQREVTTFKELRYRSAAKAKGHPGGERAEPAAPQHPSAPLEMAAGGGGSGWLPPAPLGGQVLAPADSHQLKRRRSPPALQPIAEGQPGDTEDGGLPPRSCLPGGTGLGSARDAGTPVWRLGDPGGDPWVPGTVLRGDEPCKEARPSPPAAGAALGPARPGGGSTEGARRPRAEQKKALLVAVSVAVDKIIAHFSTARNLVQKAQLGDSRLSPDVGYLLLHTLCPALYALVEDGLKPFQKDVITGQRKNSPWSVVEASVKMGPNSRSLHSLCWHVAGLAALGSTRQKFHAFVLGLLNTKQLELWISHLQRSPGVISVLYSPMAFFALSQGPFPHLADELLLLIQPLSVLTFHLDLLFEHHHLSVDPTSSADTSGTSSPEDLVLPAGAAAPTKPDDPVAGEKPLAVAPEPGANRNRAAPSDPEAAGGPPGPSRGGWLGRLFGASSPSARSFPAAPVTVSTRSRRPSSWLSPSARVLAVAVKGLASEKTPAQEQPARIVPGSAQPRRAVRALCDHTGTADGHLSFQKGDILQLLSTVDEDWICCCHGNSTGLVPVGYTSLIL
uniref:RUN and SH3 domain containing 1 n=1 Tax=Falco tinnunculus TaxID=100819 RepID=A0A8C4TX94_FALTI